MFVAKDRVKNYGSVARQFHNVVTAADAFVRKNGAPVAVNFVYLKVTTLSEI